LIYSFDGWNYYYLSLSLAAVAEVALIRFVVFAAQITSANISFINAVNAKTSPCNINEYTS
jgi:hypothetical protein